MALLDFLNIGSQIIDKLIPDPKAKAEANLKLLELKLSGEFKALEADLEIAKGQMEINKVEAGSEDLLKSGWRPMVGWTCVSGLMYTFLLQPFLSWGSAIWHIPVPPTLDMGTLMTLLMGMLGLGGFRTYEKVKSMNNK